MKPLITICFVTAMALLAFVAIYEPPDEGNSSASDRLGDRAARNHQTGTYNQQSQDDDLTGKIGRPAVAVSLELHQSAQTSGNRGEESENEAIQRAFESAERILSEAKSKDDFRKALSVLRDLAKSGHPPSLRRTAELLEKGLGIEEDPLEGYELYLQAAEAGDVLAQYRVAQLLEEGDVVEKDAEAAYEWYQKAADQNYSDAWAQLGRLIAEGTLIESDYKLAYAYYQKATEMGSQWGAFYKATALMEGWGVKQDVESAIKTLRSLGNSGFHQAQAALYITYNKGKLVEKDMVEAVNWLSKAAINDDPAFQSILADFLYKGDLLSKDVRESFALLEDSALQGHLEAIHKLSYISFKEAKSREERDRSLDILGLAAEYGHHRSQLDFAYVQAIRAEATGETEIYDNAISVLEGALDNPKAQYAIGLHKNDGVPLKTAIRTAKDSEYVERQNYTADTIHREEGRRPPKAIHTVTPEYPQGLLIQEFTGQVVVRMIVDKNGNPSKVLIENSPRPALTESAKIAVEQWKFEPGLRDGIPVNTRVRIPMTFKIRK